MKYGIGIASLGVSRNPQDYARLARDDENAGWGGFFLWDHINYRAGSPNHDPRIRTSFANERVSCGRGRMDSDCSSQEAQSIAPSLVA